MTGTYEQRIAALLAKAEGTDNQHEADAFSAKAEALMIKWGIDEAAARASIDPQRAKHEGIVMETWSFTSSGKAYQQSLLNAICLGTGMGRFIKYTQRSGPAMGATVAYTSDQSRIMQLFESLDQQGTNACRAWAKSNSEYQLLTSNMERFKARRQFRISFAHVLYSRLQSMYQTEVVSSGSELAVRSRDDQLEDYMRTNLNLTGPQPSRLRSGIGAARDAGRQAGNEARLHSGELV